MYVLTKRNAARSTNTAGAAADRVKPCRGTVPARRYHQRDWALRNSTMLNEATGAAAVL
jgi:hypothetical protein